MSRTGGLPAEIGVPMINIDGNEVEPERRASDITLAVTFGPRAEWGEEGEE
jgi:hypothetical protein